MKFNIDREWLLKHLDSDIEEPGGLMACSPELYKEIRENAFNSSKFYKSQDQYINQSIGTFCTACGSDLLKFKETEETDDITYSFKCFSCGTSWDVDSKS